MKRLIAQSRNHFVRRLPIVVYPRFRFSTIPDQGGADTVAESMKDAKQFMQEAKELNPIYELGTLAEWQPEVMEWSTPVILDCYAEWCAPCKKLEPILKEKVLA